MKRPIIEILGELVGYLLRTRGVGHTTAMLEGAKTKAPNRLPALVLALGPQHRQALQSLSKNFYSLSLDHLGYGHNRLAGLTCPLLIDNAALLEIFAESLRQMDKNKAISDMQVERIRDLEDQLQLAERAIASGEANREPSS